MPIKVDVVARIIEKCVVIEEASSRIRAGDIAAMLTNLPEVKEKPSSEAQWKLECIIGEGDTARGFTLQLPVFLNLEQYDESLSKPVFFSKWMGECFWFFKEKIYKTNRDKFLQNELDEIELRIKLHDLEESTLIKSLSQKVSNLTKAINAERKTSTRRRIPDDVQIAVYTRDNGACVKCGSSEEIHFDHIIPFSKGGSDSFENIQVLCRTCNLKKSASIGG